MSGRGKGGKGLGKGGAKLHRKVTFRVSPSPPSKDWLTEVVSSASQA